ncbi:hypothetical protein KDA14_05175, partial [Candidatus Saccharibacteria bacterium]|nr:hypothetical protein [Candidatus Saccharibacteria bacterium]
ADVNGDGVVAPEEVASTYPSHLVQMSCRTATGRKGPLAVGVNMKKYEMLEQYTSTVAVGMVTVRCEIAQSGVNKIGRHGDFAAVVSPNRPKSEVNVAGCYDDGVQAAVQHPGK